MAASSLGRVRRGRCPSVWLRKRQGRRLNGSQLGVIGSSRKPDERRLPIHPDHLARLPAEVREQLIFETGYGACFGLTDAWFIERSGGVASRAELLRDLGAVILAKPLAADLDELRPGGTIWGYTHCTQQRRITQSAIDRRLNLVAFEDMYAWSPTGTIGRHTFYKNNELAGYCAVIHALALEGIDGHYGKERKAIIFGFGAVSRGAIYSLKARGFRDITICIQRPDHEVREEVLDCRYVRVRAGGSGEPRMVVVDHDGRTQPLVDLISQADILVNGTFQAVENPICFVAEGEAARLKAGSLIIDVSCDEGMGFSFARPTSFASPTFRVHQSTYYAVDHTPSYLWRSATRAISAALIVHLPSFLAGPANWRKFSTIRNAINIEAGVIRKLSILEFQRRSATYPHTLLESQAVEDPRG